MRTLWLLLVSFVGIVYGEPTRYTAKVDVEEWIPVGSEMDELNPFEFLTAAFDRVDVTVTAATSELTLYWYGGTEVEPRNLAGWNKKNCRGWVDALTFNMFPAVDDGFNCTMPASRLGLWAPWGRSHVYVKPTPNTFLQNLDASSGKGSVIYYVEESEPYFDTGALILFLIGVAIFILAPTLGHSRFIHLSSGTVVGALGFAILLVVVVSKMVPGKRRTALLGSTVGMLGMLGRMLMDRVEQVLADYFLFVLAYLLVGAFVGFSLSYKYRLDDDSQDLVVILLRVAAMACIVTSPSNAWIGFVTPILLLLLQSVSLLDVYDMICCVRGGKSTKQVAAARVPDFSDETEEEYKGSVHYNTPSRGRITPAVSPEQPSPVMTRAARKKYLQKHLPKTVNPSDYHCKGAAEYITNSEYERTKNETTERELAKLYRKLQKGGDYVSLLSPTARRRVAKTLTTLESEEEYRH